MSSLERRQGRWANRSVLLLHLLLLARAVGLAASGPSLTGEYAALYAWVAWMPLAPDVTWSLISALTAGAGVVAWWRHKRTLWVGTLLLSGAVLTSVSSGFLVTATWVPALVWGLLGAWSLLEVALAGGGEPWTRQD